MNIFKILANGEGRINETNVSAFLGYLLDPTANHSLEYEFLKSFLEPIVNDKKFKVKEYDYQIFFEQGFSKDEKKQKVDIVIVCYYIELGGGSETKVKNFINNTKSIKKVFLIENKINTGSFKKEQVQNQFESYKNNSEGENNPDIYSIYLTPKNKTFEREFEELTLKNKFHFYWKDEGNINSIKNILIDIVKKESSAEIEAINEYTRHTLKSFIQFIETDFKSEKQIKKDGAYTNTEKKLNADSNIEGKLKEVKELLEEKIPNKVGDPNLSRPKSPELWVYSNDILITINAGFKPRNRISLSYRVNSEKENSKTNLEQLASALNLKLKYADDKKWSYCSTPEMEEKIKFKDSDEIVLAVKEAVKNIEKHL
jgi:hypothetical protein